MVESGVQTAVAEKRGMGGVEVAEGFGEDVGAEE